MEYALDALMVLAIGAIFVAQAFFPPR